MTIKAIIFDFDGLIVDTETPEIEAWKDFYNQYGLEFPTEEYLKAIGMTYEDDTPLKIMKQKLGESFNEKQAFDEFNQYKLSVIEKEQLCEGVLDYLQEAGKLGLSIGLASSSKLEWVGYFLDKHEIRHYFDTINTLDNVKNPKPDPELYTRAVTQLGLQPYEAVALEDSFNGIASAKEAGLFAVAVPNPVTRNLDLSRADIHLEKLSDISLSELISRLDTK